MIEETLHAAHWWVQRIISYEISVEAPSWQSHFEKVMTELLRAKYHNHWYQDDSSRGSGYRAISNEYSLDPILEKAARAVSHSLHKYLAQMVLTSDDRWLVMFVNPGIVFVRNKRNSDDFIYDQQHHIFNKSLKKRSLKWAKSHLQKSKAMGSMHSKSDDEMLGAVDETKSDDDSPFGTKSDPEDCVTVDFKKSFMDAVQEKARIIKEKEIAKHVEDFKEEMRLNHHNTRNYFGPYDEEHSKHWHQRSPSKSSNSGTTSTRSSASSRSSPIKSPNDHIHSNKTQEVSASPRQSSRPITPSAIASSPTAASNGSLHENRSGKTQPNGQILNVLNTMNIEKLQNGLSSPSYREANSHYNHFHHPHPHTQNGNNHLSTVHFAANKEFGIDCSASNYGKHLKEILHACRIHSQWNSKHNNNNTNHINSKNGFKNGSSTSHITNSNKSKTASNSTLHDNVYTVSMDGEYPLLFPTSFASPSPSMSPTVSPLNSFLDQISLHEMDDEPTVLGLSKSEPSTATISKMNGSTKIHTKKSTNHVADSVLDLNLMGSSSSEEECTVQGLSVGMLRSKLGPAEAHKPCLESEASSEMSHPDVSCASSPIYDSASPPTNDEQNVSPSSNGSRSCMDEELKYWVLHQNTAITEWFDYRI